MMMRKIILLLLMTTIGLANMANASAHLCDMDAMAKLSSAGSVTAASSTAETSALTTSGLSSDIDTHSMHHGTTNAVIEVLSHDVMQDHSCCEQPMSNNLNSLSSHKQSITAIDESFNVSNNLSIDHNQCGDCQLEFGSVGAALLPTMNLQSQSQTNQTSPFSMALCSAPMQETLVVPIA